ncbi:hypothetical protein N9X12_09085 [Alphaproteobacteria bacterium]|nr:hypothetical protein [Alphaproteobacteria bacterium]
MSAAYIDVEAADRWCQIRNHNDWAEASNTIKAAALVKAADLIDAHFTFRGHRQAVDQLRAWPRSGIHDKAGRTISAIPPAVIAANCVLALALIEDAGGVAELLGLRGAILSERIGSVAVRYSAAGSPSQGRIKALLAPFLETTNSTRIKRT